jgi:hypothetical protein
MFAGSKCYKLLFFVGNVYQLEDLGVDKRIILNWIFEKQDEDA